MLSFFKHVNQYNSHDLRHATKTIILNCISDFSYINGLDIFQISHATMFSEQSKRFIFLTKRVWS
ncbi:hypothetical protein AWI19_22315 [Enterobacter hormaechei subsp. xiangfangensis]|nr:hypothetical protein AWI19_22315 [Enterobacter hormaechei subsp. xiangfangensis]